MYDPTQPRVPKGHSHGGESGPAATMVSQARPRRKTTPAGRYLILASIECMLRCMRRLSMRRKQHLRAFEPRSEEVNFRPDSPRDWPTSHNSLRATAPIVVRFWHSERAPFPAQTGNSSCRAFAS
jgi:hypothetical protein